MKNIYIYIYVGLKQIVKKGEKNVKDFFLFLKEIAEKNLQHDLTHGSVFDFIKEVKKGTEKNTNRKDFYLFLNEILNKSEENFDYFLLFLHEITKTDKDSKLLFCLLAKMLENLLDEKKLKSIPFLTKYTGEKDLLNTNPEVLKKFILQSIKKN